MVKNTSLTEKGFSTIELIIGSVVLVAIATAAFFVLTRPQGTLEGSKKCGFQFRLPNEGYTDQSTKVKQGDSCVWGYKLVKDGSEIDVTIDTRSSKDTQTFADGATVKSSKQTINNTSTSVTAVDFRPTFEPDSSAAKLFQYEMLYTYKLKTTMSHRLTGYVDDVVDLDIDLFTTTNKKLTDSQVKTYQAEADKIAQSVQVF